MNKTLEFVANILNCNLLDLTEQSELGDPVAWDSMGHLNLMLALEAKYGVDINENSVEFYRKIKHIEQVVEEVDNGKG